MFRDQIPIVQHADLFAERKTKVEEIMQRNGLSGNSERVYVYNVRGRIAERHMRMGSVREDLTFSYNEHGDISELTIETNGFPHAVSLKTQSPLKCGRVYGIR